MLKVEQCTALPGCCYVCRSSNREWYIDLLQSVDYYGAMYICNECVMEMAHQAGMVTSDEAIELRARVQWFEDENFDLRVKVSGLEQAIDGLRIAGRSIGTGPNPSSTLLDDSAKQVSSVGEESVGHEGREIDESGDDSDVGELHTDESSPDRSSFSLDLGALPGNE